jgi:hypothetical protein
MFRNLSYTLLHKLPTKAKNYFKIKKKDILCNETITKLYIRFKEQKKFLINKDFMWFKITLLLIKLCINIRILIDKKL